MAGTDGVSHSQLERIVAVGTAQDFIASFVAGLAPMVHRTRSDGTVQKLPEPAHIIDPDGEGYGVSDWIYRVVVQVLSTGNVTGIITERAPGPVGYPRTVMLTPLIPYEDHSGTTPTIRWRSNLGDTIDPDMVWHKRAYPKIGQLLGQSQIERYAETIGISVKSNRYAGDYFDSNGLPSVVMRYKGDLNSVGRPKIAAMKHAFAAAMRGGRAPFVTDDSWDLVQMPVSAEEAQFLETKAFSASECARIYGPGMAEALGYSSGSSLTYSNIVDKIDHINKFIMDRWIRFVEKLLTEMLPAPQAVTLDRNQVLSMSMQARYSALSTALGSRPWLTVNEARQSERYSPIDGGDTLGTTAPDGTSAGDGGTI